MRVLIWIVLLLAALWSGWWVVGSRAAQRAATAALAQLRADGWTAEAADISLRGFPNRFDTTFDTLTLAPPGGLPRWQAPFFQILALSYRPTHVIALFPPAQDLVTAAGPIRITADDMRASLRLETSTRLALERFTLSTKGLDLTGSPVTGAESAILATRQTAGRADAHDLALDIKGLRIGAAMRALLDPAALLPDTLGLISIDATLAFDAPWDRFAAERQPQLTAVELRRAGITWGEMQLTADGALAVDAQGLPEGRIRVSAQNWRHMLTLARNAGGLSPEWVETLERGLGVLEEASPGTIKIPLTFAGGRISFGAIPLGPAPRLR